MPFKQLLKINHKSFLVDSNSQKARFYRFLFEQLPKNDALAAIWKSKSLPKLKVFSWLLMIDRLNTRDLMQRKQWHLDTGPNCVLCQSGSLEDRDQLLFNVYLLSSVGTRWVFSGRLTDLCQRFLSARSSFVGPCFMEVVACCAWNIWKIRNDSIFKHVPVYFNRWKVGFQSDVMLHTYKIKTELVQPLVAWLADTFV